jgi:hypothetical protein
MRLRSKRGDPESPMFGSLVASATNADHAVLGDLRVAICRIQKAGE